jgi:hypothetical protein
VRLLRVNLSSLRRDYLPQSLGTVAAVGLTFFTADDDTQKLRIPVLGIHPERWIFVLLFGLVLVGAGLMDIRRQHRFTALQRDFHEIKRELNETVAAFDRAVTALNKLARLELHGIAHELNYFSSERISLFLHTGGHFELVARFSENPSDNNADRRIYPIQGCLREAWESDRCSLVISTSRDQDRVAWARQHVASGLPAETVENLTMGVRTLIACRVNDQRDGEAPLGVLVLESTQTADTLIQISDSSAVLDAKRATNMVVRYFGRLGQILALYTQIDEPDD